MIEPMRSGRDGVTSDLDKWAKETAQMIIWGLLREEGWELPGDSDEEITTDRLVQALKDAVVQRLTEEPAP